MSKRSMSDDVVRQRCVELIIDNTTTTLSANTVVKVADVLYQYIALGKVPE